MSKWATTIALVMAAVWLIAHSSDIAIGIGGALFGLGMYGLGFSRR